MIMTYTARVKKLNSCYNEVTDSTITSFLVENLPAVVDAELQKHGLLSSNSESSRARPIGGVSLQVLTNPYIPNWTINQKGMSGAFADSSTSYKADYYTKQHVLLCREYARNLIDLGIHKQDANKAALSPFTTNHVIITATEWGSFLKLRCSSEAHPAMQSMACAIKELLKLPPDNRYSPDHGFFTPYPDQETFQAVAKVASVSYANHSKDRSPENSLRLVKQLADSKHASPFCMAARPVYPGQLVNHTRMDGTEHRYIVFDNFEKELSSLLYAKHFTDGGKHELIDTDNYHGWLSLRRLEGF
jgi:Thymidylate synthase complementing protein